MTAPLAGGVPAVVPDEDAATWNAAASPPPGVRPTAHGLTAGPADALDPGHLVSAAEWALIESVANGRGPRGAAFDATVSAKFHGGVMAGGPTFVVIHDAETPLATGYADAIARYFQAGPAAGTSAHAMVGPEKALRLLPDNVVAYAAGPNANTRGWHLEQAGYARLTRAEWTTPAGLAQLARTAAAVREVAGRWGIPLRWCTDQQLRDAAAGRGPGGLTTHDQVRRVLGGTTHVDPSPYYPTDLLMQALQTGDDEMALTPTFDADVRGELAGHRALLTAILGQLTGNDDHSLNDDLRDVLAAMNARDDALDRDVRGRLQQLFDRGDVTAAQVAEQLLPGLVSGISAALSANSAATPEQVREQVEAGLRSVLGGLA